MGKAQSKRSVDITPENKEGVAVAEGEVGKVGKIEDVDQKPQLNGDANKEADSGTNEAKEEKKDEVENEKDAATEKTEPAAVAPEAAAGEPAAAATTTEADKKVEEKPAEGGDSAENAADTTTGTLDESKDGAETAGDDANATPATDSAKKPKKEKTKKRFLSFRSFSFSKKDKTKPKKEEAAANTTNGECEKVPEEGTEDAAAAATATSGDEKAEVAAPVTNGTTDEVKTNGEQAPVATPEDSVTPPSNGDSKPIVDAAKETVNEVIVAASKSVDEKLNAVAKPEVNMNADQDLHENQTHTQALDTADSEQKHEHALSECENANIDTVPNNIVDIDTDSNGVVDCTNNSLNNDNIHSQSAPPLPECPPPSQITVFAETAMSVDLAQVENPQTLPIIQTDTNNVHVLAGSALVGDTETVSASKSDADADNAAIVHDDTAATATTAIQSEPETQAATETNVTAPELPKPHQEIVQTIEMLDRVNLNESDVKTNESVAENVVVVAETNIEPEPLSADISSPLPHNSLDTLPSPQSLSSNVTPPNEMNNDDDSVTVELTHEDATSLLPPPPPPVDDIAMAIDKSSADQTVANVHDDVTQNGNDDSLPPPPSPPTAQDLIENEICDELKTNGVSAVQHNQNHSVEAQSDDGTLNGSTKEHDEAANNISDKANGVGNDNSVSEKVNGDHKTIEEITTSDKLEKLAAANPPPSKEVVAAE